MSLSVSINGGDRVPATDVVLYDDGIAIAGALMHGNIVFYADSVRDPQDLAGILDELGIRVPMARQSKIILQAPFRG